MHPWCMNKSVSKVGPVFLVVALAAMGQARPVFAQILPFRASSAVTIGFEERALRSLISRTRLSGLREDGKRISDSDGREMDVTVLPIVVPFAVHRAVVPIVMVPVVHKRLSTNTPSGRRATTNSGMGDATLLLKIAPLQWDRLNESRRIAFFGGVKLPTGSTSATDGAGGDLPASLQIGTGAYEFPLGVSFTVQTPTRFGVVTDAFYRVNTKGDISSGTDSFTYDVAVGWRASPSSYQTFRERVLNLYLEFNGRHEMGTGDLLYLSPGVQFIAQQNLLVEFSTQIPVYQDFTGIRAEVDYTVSGGFRWLFPF